MKEPTIEEKQLLLQDLCARLPYGVMIQIPELFYPQRKVTEKLVTINDLWHFNDDGTYIENVKPYLRPMSSMTEKERLELSMLSDNDSVKFYLQGKDVKLCFMSGDCLQFHKVFDWLNAHHFDYRGLIDKGLALEAPEGMYK